MSTSWLDLAGAALSGGLVVKVLDYLYTEYRRQREASLTAKQLIDKHLDPVLKTSEELVGKLRYLAQSDFKELKRAVPPLHSDIKKSVPYFDMTYLIAHFWARLQILSIESTYVSLGSDKRGVTLLDFTRTLETTRIRLVERSWQRAIGEVLIIYRNENFQTMSYAEFVESYVTSESMQRWMAPLIQLLSRMQHTRERQRLLVYGAVIHALLDNLDPEHTISKSIPAWSNKLSAKSRRDLKHRVFGIYLKQVKHADKYYAVDVEYERE